MLKINLTINFLLLPLAIIVGLKSKDFCFLKQKECKGFYDKSKKYQIKCNFIKCPATFSYDCGFNFCSKNISSCNKYTKMYSTKHVNPMLAAKDSNKTNEIISFYKNVRACQNKIYEFKSNDFCVNGRNCKAALYFHYFVTKKAVDCHCPKKKSFKCGKYCVIDSNACNYYKSQKNKKQYSKIKDCVNNNSTYPGPYFSFW